jgi:hypothetical protein
MCERRHVQRTILIHAILFLAAAGIAFSQVPMRDIGRPYGIGARATALGDAYLAEVSDASCMYSNPAAMIHMERQRIIVNHFHDLEFHGMDERMAFSAHLGARDAIGIGAAVSHVGYVGDNIPRQYRVIQYGVDIAYATSLTPAFAIGARVGVRHTQLGSEQVWTNSSSIGAFYYPSPNVSYGAVYNGLGSVARYDLESSPSVVREALPRSLQIGAAMRYPASTKQRIFTITLVNEKMFDETGLRYKGGLEIYPVRFLALRIGQSVESSSTGTTRFGAGIVAESFEFDFAMPLNESPVQYYEVSLSIGI